LQKLNLVDTQIPDTTIENLEKQLPQCKINY